MNIWQWIVAFAVVGFIFAAGLLIWIGWTFVQDIFDAAWLFKYERDNLTAKCTCEECLFWSEANHGCTVFDIYTDAEDFCKRGVLEEVED